MDYDINLEVAEQVVSSVGPIRVFRRIRRKNLKHLPSYILRSAGGEFQSLGEIYARGKYTKPQWVELLKRALEAEEKINPVYHAMTLGHAQRLLRETAKD